MDADISLLERPVADYAETSFMRFALWPSREAAFNVLEDVRASYDTQEVQGYREWHDGFVFQRIINIHKNHGIRVQNLSPDAKDLDAFHTSPLASRLEHFKGAKKDAQNTPKSIPILVQPKDSMPDDYIKNNIVENVRLIERWVERCRVNGGRGVVVSAGPSVDYSELHAEYYDGKTVSKNHILCVKHTLPAMHKAGIVPWGCLVLDPRPIDGTSTHGVIRKDLFENIDKRTIFFVASMTDPSVTRYLIERGATIVGFHAYSNAIKRVAEDEDFPLDSDTVYITGGTCAATRAVGLLHTLGFREVTMIGLDGSFPEPPDDEKNDKISSHDGKEREKYLSVNLNDINFWTSGELLAMAQDCERLFDKTDLDIEIDFVGEGTLCSETWKNRKLRPLKDMKDVARGY
jgi:hypothetical protein